MMRFIFIVCSFLFQTSVFTQNLVANGSFEDENICAEYQKNCAPEAWVGSSLWSDYYFYEGQYARTGTHCVGLTAGSVSKPDVRNFIRTRLLCGLRKGHQYWLEFYIRSLHPVLDSIGVYFSAGDFLYEKNSFKNIQPQLWSVNGLDSIDTDPTIWHKVHFVYTATGEEGYLTIGNFKRMDYTDIHRPDYQKNYYFFLDDVLFAPIDGNEKLCITADSVKKSIYQDNARHGYISMRQRSEYNNKNPKNEPLPKTMMPYAFRIDTLIIPDIFFATGSHILSHKNISIIDSFLLQLKIPLVDSIVINGHTDSVGKFDYNMDLSVHRAQTIKKYLLQKLPSLKDKTIARGYSFLQPLATNKTPEGRQQNRRVEIFVYRKE